ncbi:YbaN family protein [Vibrio maerlii]|uniref:YbaN family protein n=1 Tax=Vibrio maerlii TaxID=2231648 RepID=UPI000E3C74EC|nr:YbaN family protein [Vibrio maerlii]
MIRRTFFNLIGGVSLLLGILGIFLPLLPTTPFVLLASACFMRGSPRFHHWLNQHPTLGPMLHNWHQNRAVTKRVKRNGLITILLSFSFSIYVAPVFWVKCMLIVLLVVLITWFIRLPTHE